MFCDELRIKLVAGKGGDGCASFRREKFVPKGGPDGGDGGNGGHIILEVDENINTLGHLTNGKVYKAPLGEPGKGKNMHGKNAECLIIKIPPGTIVFNGDKSEMLGDLEKTGTRLTIAKGGKGGMGNARFVSSTHQVPRFAETGEPGENLAITLELKLVADVGLIGLPSAGKSTLISVISNAKPKIAAYHFTTLTPNLGVVNMSKFGGSKSESFVVADIPGLIEGASTGKGLGHQFLKHITRTKLLVHIIDTSLDDVAGQFKTINQELKNFSKELAECPQIVVLNKLDILSEEQTAEKLKEIKKAQRKFKVFPISAITHEGLKPLLYEILQRLQEIRKDEIARPKLKERPILRPHLNTVPFRIDKVERNGLQKIFYVSGQRIDQIAVMTDTSNQEGLERIYRQIEIIGIRKAVQKKKATFGDIICIKGKHIPYRK